MPALSAVVVTFRQRELARECLDSVTAALARVEGETELIVVDNASRDGTVEMVQREFPSARLIVNETNLGFAPALVAATACARGRWLATINSDVTLGPDALRRMLTAGESGERIGSVCAQMRFVRSPDVINSAGLEVDRLGLAGLDVGTEPTEVFGSCAGAAIFRSSMLAEVGGFDPTFFAYLEDADLAWRARVAGWRALYQPQAIALHHHSSSLGHGSELKYFLVGRNRVRMLAKNASGRQLLAYGIPIVLYDAAYVIFTAIRDRTLSPLRGRLRGLSEWRRYRRSGAATRGRTALAPARGIRAALRRRHAWAQGGSEPRAMEDGAR